MIRTAALFFFAPWLLPAQTPPSSPLVIQHVAVIDATGAPAQPGMTVMVAGGRVVALGKNLSIPREARTLDATGKFLIPGLWDMHSHIHRPEDLQLFVANGVTGLRVMAFLPAIAEMRKRIESGEEVGPRMTIASRLMDGADSGQPAATAHMSEAEIAQEWSDVVKGGRPRSIVARNAAEGRQAVIDAKNSGAEFIKVHEDLSREAYFAIASESKKEGLVFVGHVPQLVSAAEASDAGQTSIEHLQGVLLACSTREKELLKATEEVSALPANQRPQALLSIQRQTADTFSQDKAASLAALFKKNRTWECPTLTSRFGTKDRGVRAAGELPYISSQMRTRWQRGLSATPEATSEQQAVAHMLDEKLLAVVGTMHRAGVQFVAGTDVGGAFLVPGFSIHDELDELVKAGFSPMEALQAATLNAARFLHRDQELGTVQKGKLADLVLLDANPLDDIGNTKRISAVIVNGRLLDRNALDTSLARVKAASNP